MAELDKNSFEVKYNDSSTGLFKANTTQNRVTSQDRQLVTDLKDSILWKQDNKAWYDCGNWDFSTNSDLFPASGGSGGSGAIMKNNTFDITGAGTPSGATEPIPVGATIRALTDSPGQTVANWRVYY